MNTKKGVQTREKPHRVLEYCKYAYAYDYRQRQRDCEHVAEGKLTPYILVLHTSRSINVFFVWAYPASVFIKVENTGQLRDQTVPSELIDTGAYMIYRLPQM